MIKKKKKNIQPYFFNGYSKFEDKVGKQKKKVINNFKTVKKLSPHRQKS